MPAIQGFKLFEEARPWSSKTAYAWISKIGATFSDLDGRYQAFLEEKAARGNSDLYAAFQPFNESTRALYAFLPLLKEKLHPGDIILDTWCRTGWSGELLAGLFPEQKVISIWEGNNNVLGYKGFQHWLPAGKRLPNLEIIFSHPDHPLPLADNSVRVVHGLDSLHRYRQSSFLPECLRVCDEDGLLIFPHIHLTNDQPEPYFDRGCHQYHGTEWKEWLDLVLEGSNRAGWVFAEAQLFEESKPFVLTDQSNTHHYNGLVLIADQENEGRQVEPIQHLSLQPNYRLVTNPMVSLRLHQCEVEYDPDNLAGLASAMMMRHPCYAERLSAVIGTSLNPDEARFIWHAQEGIELRAIAAKMGIGLDDVKHLAQKLCDREILHGAPVSQTMADLQNFYGFVRLPQARPDTFGSIWEDMANAYDQRVVIHWLEDDSRLDIDDIVYLVDAVRSQLDADGLSKGDQILVACNHNPEALLLCWAAWLQGLVTAIIDNSLSAPDVNKLIDRCNATKIFTDRVDLTESHPERTVLFDAPEAEIPRKSLSFSDWLDDSLDSDVKAPRASIDPNDAAAILFTSGTTGKAKGVVLSQRALCYSGHNMADSHGWDKETLLSLGPLSMMSGLRNPTLAAPISGSTILLPGRSTTQLPMNAWSQAQYAGATVITSVPAWLSGIVTMYDRLEPNPGLRQVLVTGTALNTSLYEIARTRLEIPLGNYYGLTETGGICTVALSDEDAGTLGRPADALLQVLGDDGKPVKGEKVGRLRVHSEQLMSGYLDDPATTSKALQGGWLLTGDLAHWDPAGRLVLDGREDELLNLRDGTRFHPNEVESLLTALPEVEAAAVLLNDASQTLIALVISTSDPVTIRTQISSSVGRQLLPDEIYCVPSLPIGSNGKLLRNRLPDLINKQ